MAKKGKNEYSKVHESLPNFLFLKLIHNFWKEGWAGVNKKEGELYIPVVELFEYARSMWIHWLSPQMLTEFLTCYGDDISRNEQQRFPARLMPETGKKPGVQETIQIDSLVVPINFLKKVTQEYRLWDDDIRNHLALQVLPVTTAIPHCVLDLLATLPAKEVKSCLDNQSLLRKCNAEFGEWYSITNFSELTHLPYGVVMYALKNKINPEFSPKGVNMLLQDVNGKRPRWLINPVSIFGLFWQGDYFPVLEPRPIHPSWGFPDDYQTYPERVKPPKTDGKLEKLLIELEGINMAIVKATKVKSGSRTYKK